MNAGCSKMGDPESETHRVTTVPTYILTYIHCKCKHGPLWSYFPFQFFYLTEIPHLRSWSEPTSDWLTGLTEPLLPVANLAPTVAARSSSTMIPGRIRRQLGLQHQFMISILPASTLLETRESLEIITAIHVPERLDRHSTKAARAHMNLHHVTYRDSPSSNQFRTVATHLHRVVPE